MKTKSMHLMTRISVSLFICGMIVFWGFQAIGEEWTAEQKEVWDVVIADFEKFKQGDVEGLSSSRHEDVIIWWGSESVPFDKKMALYKYRGWFDYDKPVKWELEPLAIKIVGNVASVFYLYKFSGSITSGSGRDMETWIKQNNKWIMINSFGASCDELPPCK
jgi:hypothetical protein